MGGSVFRADIQGLRAVAVLAVVAQHAGLAWAPGGFVGVDVFFVVSGFLITGMLVRELEQTGRIDLPAFTARRARRILPAALVVLVPSAAVAYAVVSPLLRDRTVTDAIATALFVPNYVFALRDTDYFADATPSVFQHYWSLGVEEQWYLVCPALLLAAWVLGRRRGQARHAVVIALVAVTVVSFVACVLVTSQSQPWAFFALWTRAWEFGIGALVALLPAALVRRVPLAGAVALGWAGLAGILITVVFVGETHAFPGAIALLPVASTAAVILCGSRLALAEHRPRFGPDLVLTPRPMQFVGGISYSLYLVHWPLLLLIPALLPGEWRGPWLSAALGLAGIPLAWLLYRGIEQPVRRARALVAGAPRRTLWAALAGTVVVAALGAATLAFAPAPALATSSTVPRTAPAAPPDATPFVPANLTPTIPEAPEDEPAMYADGCNLGYADAEPTPCSYGEPSGPRVVLWGDSHAAHWAPALIDVAQRERLDAVVHTKSRCSSAFRVHVLGDGPFEACDEWRAAVLAELRADPPDVLIVTGYAEEAPPEGTDPATAWRDGLREIVDALPDSTSVVLLADSPDLKRRPLDCLLEHLEDALACGAPAAEALAGPTREAMREVAATTRAHLVDLTPYFCAPPEDGGLCPAISGGVLMYRDSHHLTATFSTALGPALGEAIARELGGWPGL
ncbi:acyltransferase family protein [Microbacterium album]|uniref:Acyltransferase n=1 Tax=Microbacterium album TaxID=2053191 RepID=A0A917ICY5_9MICO|nr:acyltransferase family protein [Microbacterium album]GGH39957.1 acyltransferase [Microbacterium album]